MACYDCLDVVAPSDAVSCSGCRREAHKKCASLGGLPNKNIEKVNWICTPCLNKLKYYLKEGESLINKVDKLRERVEERLDNVDSSVESVRDTLTRIEKSTEQPFSPPSSSSSSSLPPSTSYAGVVKKHLLVVKSTDDSKKASEKKREISNVLAGLQIVDTKFQRSGNVVLNFENDSERDEAAMKVGGLGDLSVVKTKELFPKIMICNVSAEENKDELVKTMIMRNDYLKSIDDITSKISLIFAKNAAGETKHYILKCHPDVRGLIYRKGDEIKLEWGVYKVRARYFATMCYHCLNYGHVQGKCPTKDTEGPCCRKCAGEHSVDNCSSSVKKCKNCVRAGKTDVNHSASEMCCPVLNAEIAKIRNKTDHGY